jgi:hypothetical protein
VCIDSTESWQADGSSSAAVRVFGNTAIVTGSYRETQRKAGAHTVTRWRFVDTWAYKKHGWVLIAAGSTPVRD